MASDTVDNAEDEPSLAPFYAVPPGRIIAIEHPGVVENVARGIKTLGGERRLMQILDESTKNTGRGPQGLAAGMNQVGVILRPKDVLARNMLTANVPTQNVLLKVTVPKRTGRKRKSGSDEPFVEPTTPEKILPGVLSAPDLIQRLRDNSDRYKIQAVGMLHETHRIHNVPDIQLRLSGIPIMRRLRDTIMKATYDSLSKHDVDVESGSYCPNGIPPPPAFLAPGPPLQYGYQQHCEPLRTPVPPSRMPLDVNTPVPQRPPAHLPTTHIRAVTIALPLLRKLLERRPIITIYVAAREVPAVKKHLLEIALLYLTYHADFGPWRGAYIRYGVDPRTSNEHRLAQTIHIDRPPEAKRSRGSAKWTRKSGEKFIFDGKRVDNPQQRIYQLCDLKEPLLHSIVEKQDARDKYDNVFGWLHPGDMVKLQVLTREMIDCVLRGTPVPTSEHEIVAEMPGEMADAKSFIENVQGDADQVHLAAMLDEILERLADAEKGHVITAAASSKNDDGGDAEEDDENSVDESGEEEDNDNDGEGDDVDDDGDQEEQSASDGDEDNNSSDADDADGGGEDVDDHEHNGTEIGFDEDGDGGEP